jgi:hypothetical protein
VPVTDPVGHWRIDRNAMLIRYAPFTRTAALAYICAILAATGGGHERQPDDA